METYILTEFRNGLLKILEPTCDSQMKNRTGQEVCGVKAAVKRNKI